MKAKIKANYLERSKILKALAHPVRLFIVDELSRQERCVCELRDMVDLDISTVSKHLSVLKNAGIVEDNKRGLQVFYKLLRPCVTRFFTCLEAMVETGEKQAKA
jgi:DNA-binding transcriptional ArsR family regulator